MCKILIVDDHQVVRNGLRHVLTDEFPNAEFGEAKDVAEFFRKIKEKKWDIIILDINMPGRNGLDVLLQMKKENNKTPVLVLSMHAEEQIAIRVLKLGAFGYLSKETSNTELIVAVRQILGGKKYITSAIAQQLAEQIGNPSVIATHQALSEREYQTLLLIASGKTVSQIAEELSLSLPTISTFRTRILEKMNMKCTAELITYSIRNNLI